MSEADDAMIAGCLAGDDRAWVGLLRCYEGDVSRQMWRFSRDKTVCEELVQEVFVQVYKSLPGYRRSQTPFLHWVRRIATRVGYRFWKQQSRRASHVPLEAIDPRKMPATPGAEFHETGTTDPAAAAAMLHEMLARLPATDRLVLTLHYFEACSMEEIAQRTGWNRAAVKMRAMRAREKLRKILREENFPGASGGLEGYADGTA